MDNALEKFSFSRLPKRERIAQILVQAMSTQVTFSGSGDSSEKSVPYLLSINGVVDFLAVADLLDKYSVGNFTDPFSWEMFQTADPEAAE